MFPIMMVHLKTTKCKTTKYIHWHFRIGWFRFSFYKLKKRFNIRLEISRGWEK